MNLNSIISMVNVLGKQRNYAEILKIVKKLDLMDEQVVHPLLTRDLASRDILYFCLYKNLMAAEGESQKLQAVQFVIDSLRKK